MKHGQLPVDAVTYLPLADARNDLARAVLDWGAAGFSLLPIRPDGTKAPAISWGAIAKGEAPPLDQESLVEQVVRGSCDGIAVVAGVASGNVEVIELEGRAAERLEDLSRVADQLGLHELLQRLLDGCLETSPSGGFHFFYRLSDGVAKPNTKLARRPNHEDPLKPLILAETRGQGGYMICSPSFGRTHDTGRPYEMLVGSPGTTPTFTAAERDELFRLFRTLDEMPVTPEPAGGTEPTAARRGQHDLEALSPGDDFNSRVEWADILVGWTPVLETVDPAGGRRVHWRRPGKTIGTSATTGGTGDWLYVFSTSTALPSEKALNKFAAYTYLNHSGDFGAAARELSRKGYGTSGLDAAGGPAEILPYQAFPTHCLPEPVRSFVLEGAAAANCDPAHIAMPALAAIAAAIGNARHLVLKETWKVPPTLWTATVGDSGSKKSVGSKLALGPVMEIERRNERRYQQACRQYDREKAVWERSLQQWKKQRGGGAPPDEPFPPTAERALVDDTTLEALAPLLKTNPRGLLLAKDELKGWFGSFDKYSSNSAGGSDESHWLSMYNGAQMVIDRKTGKRPSIHVPRATMSITGNIPPGILRRAFTKERRESGLAARFLLAFPPRRLVQWTEATISGDVKRAYEQLFVKLYGLQAHSEQDGGMTPLEVALTPGAKALVEAFYNRHNLELHELTGDLAAVWSKLEETAGRLALVVHVIRCEAGEPGLNPLVLDEGSMEAGVRLVEWFKHETQRIYAVLAEGEAEEEDRRMLEWLERNGGATTVREVQQKCSWLKAAGQAERALQKLVDAGYGEWEAAGNGNRGRPSKRFTLAGRHDLRK